jgi:hypothetical protein
MSSHTLYPLNTLWRLVTIETVNASDGSTEGATTGTVTAFLAVSNEPDVTTADATLSVAATHVGVADPAAGQWPLGTWLITIPASVLTVALLDQLFTTVTPYLIVERTGSDRVYEKLHYHRSRKADFA